jgi:hypothetical protein
MQQQRNPIFTHKASIVAYVDDKGSLQVVDASTIAGWTTYRDTAASGSGGRSLQAVAIGRATIIRNQDGVYTAFYTTALHDMLKDLVAEVTTES